MAESKAKIPNFNIEVDETFAKTSIKVEKRTSIVLTILLCPSVLRNIPARLAGSTFYYQAGNTMYCRTLLL